MRLNSTPGPRARLCYPAGMRTSRWLGLALVLLALSTGCARCGQGAASSPERFIAADSAVVFVIPSLGALSQQGADALATAGTFPGGQTLLDGRAVLQGRLGFDAFDPASLGTTGLDPKRGAAIGLSMKAGEKKPAADPADPMAELLGMDMPPEPDVVVTLPVADGKKLEATLARLAKEKLQLAVQGTADGKPPVVTFRKAEGDAVQLAYAVAERTAILGFGPKAIETVRAALAVPADKHVGTAPSFKVASAAVGPGQAFFAVVPAGSLLLKDAPQLKDGFAMGVRGAKDQLAVVACTLLGEREAAMKAAPKGSSPALLAKLDPGATIVARGDGDPNSYLPREDVLKALGMAEVSPQMTKNVTDALDALGVGAAFGFGLVPVKGKPAELTEAPLSFVRAELLLALKDPAKARVALRGLLEELAADHEIVPKPNANGPWKLPLPGGEAAMAVEGNQLLLVAGPAGSLQALVARSGSAFKGPTAISARALEGPLGGMYADVPRLVETVKAIPSEAYGEGPSGMVMHTNVQQWAPTVARITALSVRTELVPGAQRAEMVLEVAPPAK